MHILQLALCGGGGGGGLYVVVVVVVYMWMCMVGACGDAACM